jgi:hypothetical protein
MTSGIRSIRDCCAVFGCTSKSYSVDAGQQKLSDNIAFFSFPPEKDKHRQRLWIRVCRREDALTPSKHKICERHFLPDCILTTTASGAPRRFKMLKSDAIPTEFLPTSGGLPKKARNRAPKDRTVSGISSQQVASTG